MRERRSKIEIILILRSTSYLELHQMLFKIQDLVLQVALYLNFQSTRGKFTVGLVNVVFILMDWLRDMLRQSIQGRSLFRLLLLLLKLLNSYCQSLDLLNKEAELLRINSNWLLR